MPIHDYKCNKCDYVGEYWTGDTAPEDMRPPEACPQCKEGELEQLFSPQGQSFDIIGSCYTNDYGRKAWKRNMSVDDQAKVLQGKKDPW